MIKRFQELLVWICGHVSPSVSLNISKALRTLAEMSFQILAYLNKVFTPRVRS